MAPSMPHRIQLPLFFNTPSRFIDEKKTKSKTVDDTAFENNEKVDNGIYITAQRRLKDY